MDNKEKYISLLTKLYVEGTFYFGADNELLTLKAQALNISEEERIQLHDSRSKYYPMVLDFINKMNQLNSESSIKEEVISYCQDLGLYNEEIQILVQSLINNNQVVSQDTEVQQDNTSSAPLELVEEKEHIMKSIIKAITFFPSLAFKITFPMAKYSKGIGWFGAYLISAFLWYVWLGTFVLAFLYRRFVMKSVDNIVNS